MEKEQPRADLRGTVAPSGEQPLEPAARTAIFTALGGTLATLLSQEIKLAKVEASVSAGLARRGAGYTGAAAIAGHLVLLALSLGAAAALALLTGHGTAALVVAGAWIVAESTLVVLARKKPARARGTPGAAQRENGSGSADAGTRQPGDTSGDGG